MPGRSPSTFLTRYGPWAVVAGASEGIGAAFADELAARGVSLVLVARGRERLDAVAGEIARRHAVATRVVACDLARPESIDRVAEAAAELTVGLLVCNAAASTVGRFLDVPLEDHRHAIDVNAGSVVALAHRFGGPMAERGCGGIIVMSSLTAFQGTPLVACYGATKAFGLVFAEGLGDELRDRGVDVLACCAGATRTPGYDRVTPPRRVELLAPRIQDPGEVAREALAALGKRPLVVTGAGNRAASLVMRRLMSRRGAVKTIGRSMRRRYE